MDEKQASMRREVTIKHSKTGEIERYMGDQVYSITDKGIVIVFGPNFATRVFYPWHRIEEFSYHALDVSARKVIQGF